MKKIRLSALALAVLLFISGCGKSGSSTSGDGSTQSSAVPSDTSDMFTDRDLDTSYDESKCVKITLNGSTAACTDKNVDISGSTVTIKSEGSYLLSGELEDGMLVVDAEDSDKIQLVLSGVQISNADSAAIYVKNADKVFITTAKDTENSLSNGGEYKSIDDNNIDSVIFSKSDITLNGEGKLNVNAEAGHGIVSKDDLILASGSYEITAASHGVSGKDSVRIAYGIYKITAGKDGIHAENSDDESKGFLYIANGTFDISSDGDGMSAGLYLLSEGGNFNITSGGGVQNAQKKNDFRGGERQNTAEQDSVSTKGLKAQMSLVIRSGIFDISSADDALHSNGDVVISGGEFNIAAGDDGMHADEALTASDGTVKITESYEGLEGKTIDISGGDIDITASDDGINAAGGNDNSGFGGRGESPFESSQGVYISISGGKLHINASGDGIDSNGDLTVSGGEIYVSGAENSGNGALDYSGNAKITGGTIVAAGFSGMAQNFGSSSTQGAMLVNVNSASAGTAVTLTDSSGKEIVSWTPDKAYNSVVISAPSIKKGSSYTLKSGGSFVEITMDDIIYGSAGGMGGDMGGNNKPDMKPDGNGADKPSGGNRPDGDMGNPPSGGKPDGNMGEPPTGDRREPPNSNGAGGSSSAATA